MIVRAAALATFAFGCRAPTQITVEVRTDVCSQISGVNATIGPVGQLEGRPPTSTGPACDASSGRIGALVVTPSAGRSDEVEIRIAAGVKRSPDECKVGDMRDCIVARRALHFIPHESLVVKVDLRSICKNVDCPEGSTCVNGTCVRAAIDSNGCTGDGCDESVLPDAGPSDVSDAGDSGATIPTGWSELPSKAPLAPRVEHSAVWTGQEVIVWGGGDDTSDFGDGAAYDPVAGTWRKIADATSVGLTARRRQVAVWNGSTMMIGTGNRGGGAPYAEFGRYDPKSDSWSKMSSLPVAADFAGAAALPDGRIVVGFGRGATGILGSAFVYDPKLDKWSPTALAPARSDAKLFFLGTKVYALGGFDGTTYPTLVPFYDPSTNTWGTSAGNGPDAELVSGASGDGYAFVYGGVGGTVPTLSRTVITSASAWFDPVAGDWVKLPGPPPGALSFAARNGAAAFVGAGSFWIWGGAAGGALGDGASYMVKDKSWTPMPKGGPSPRQGATATWVGDHAIFFGGRDATTFFAEGKRFKP